MTIRGDGIRAVCLVASFTFLLVASESAWAQGRVSVNAGDTPKDTSKWKAFIIAPNPEGQRRTIIPLSKGGIALIPDGGQVVIDNTDPHDRLTVKGGEGRDRVRVIIRREAPSSLDLSGNVQVVFAPPATSSKEAARADSQLAAHPPGENLSDFLKRVAHTEPAATSPKKELVLSKRGDKNKGLPLTGVSGVQDAAKLEAEKKSKEEALEKFLKDLDDEMARSKSLKK